jgi:hypothetical protein
MIHIVPVTVFAASYGPSFFRHRNFWLAMQFTVSKLKGVCGWGGVGRAVKRLIIEMNLRPAKVLYFAKNE